MNVNSRRLRDPCLVGPLVGVLLLAVVGCGAGNEGPGTGGEPATGSGIRGRTVLAPRCPPAKEASQCPAAGVAADISVFRADSGRPVAATTSDDAGRFRVRLDPGAYRVVATPQQSMPPPPTGHVTVRVRRSSYATVTIV